MHGEARGATQGGAPPPRGKNEQTYRHQAIRGNQSSNGDVQARVQHGAAGHSKERSQTYGRMRGAHPQRLLCRTRPTVAISRTNQIACADRQRQRQQPRRQPTARCRPSLPAAPGGQRWGWLAGHES